ncbi:hypothetical protein MAPG_07743 [Magnaporthiopsis poae ATCC 64411]|uniref:Mitochondrial chaperone BCS1 n=1 Tax=Magnaporthiopsis poae (strain ATCC 64411 / 73-15) TaxID=644358 RepID=A0A0C4E5H4_MAGP6|nr:hypothetical protein MAPG_07743 [Magnaporthiopsis poae ATCC 64411]
MAASCGSGDSANNATGAPGIRLSTGSEGLMTLFGDHAHPFFRTFMALSSTLAAYLGLDLAAVVTFLGLFWAACRMARQTWNVIYGLVQEYLMASIHISSDDEIHQHVLKWLAAQPHVGNARSLIAESSTTSAWEEERSNSEITNDVPLRALDGDGNDSYLNFSYQHASTPPRYVPAMGTHGFWFRGTYFSIYRKRDSMMANSANPFGSSIIKDTETMVLSCFSFSTEPIKRLLQHVREDYFKENFVRTVIKRPNTATMRRFGGRNSWSTVAKRPIRPMSTVVLDHKQKRQLLADINEYLHPATPLWYATRGIPLRRGYLFHGPPGTGKTSLSFALAGVFGLDIFVISLLDPALTEEDLVMLFNSLPRRCVVLLEDIDTAGLRRPDDDDVNDKDDEGKDACKPKEEQQEEDGASGKETQRSDNAKEDDKAKTAHLTRRSEKKQAANPVKASAPPRAKRRGPGIGGLGFENEGNGISLSGLLNAIDGVASHEGRVLIMTTNRPEVLDEALIRPGRIDLQVAFSNATQDQACELFQRMYEPSQPRRWTRQASPTPPAARKPPPGDPESMRSSSLAPHSLAGALEAKLQAPATRVIHLFSSGNVDAAANHGGEAKIPATGATCGIVTATVHDETDEKKDAAAAATATATATGEDEEMTTTTVLTDAKELARIAAAFGAKIPNLRFSPAEIQGFLLKRKKDPRRALGEVDGWVAHMVEQKASRSKVLQVQ